MTTETVAREVRMKVWRGDATGGEFVEFVVPSDPGMVVTDVSFNYEKAKTVPPFKPKPKDPDGKRRMYQEDVERVQEFHKCIECFLCQDVCHVIRDHEENKRSFSGPRFFVRLAALEMHPLDTNERIDLIRAKHGLGYCNI